MDEEQKIEDAEVQEQSEEESLETAETADEVDTPEDSEVAEGPAEDTDHAEDPAESDTPDQEESDSTLAADEVAAVVEAILFASDSPLPISKITTAAELPTRSVRQALARLNERYEQQGAAFRIEEIAGGFQMMTTPEYNDVLRRLLSVKKDSRMTQASMETLAIIAYRQPILRADVEAIRGVATGDILRGLMEKNLVKIVGRADVIGRPMLYGTTKKFLEVFGLARLEDLPRVEELRSGENAAPPKKPKDAEPAEENEDESEEPTDENSEEVSASQPDDETADAQDDFADDEDSSDDEEFDEDDDDDEDDFDDEEDDEDYDDEDEWDEDEDDEDEDDGK